MKKCINAYALVLVLLVAMLPVRAELIEIENAAMQSVPVVSSQKDEQSFSQPSVQQAQSSGNQSQQAPPLGNQFGELYYQMQVLQQEVMMLRGQVEDQSRQLDQIKQQSLNRVVDLDRRVGEISLRLEGGEPPTSRTTSTPAKQKVAVADDVPAKEGEYLAYRACYDLVKRKKFDEAINAFKQFQIDYPNGRYTPNVYYWLGELYLTPPPRDIEAARQSFALLLENYSGHSKVPDTLYKLGKVYYLKGDQAKSQEYLDRLIKDYGETDSSAARLARAFLQDKF
jgi:tol-pal system protein YbgF